jgi:hypothetical protein
MKTEGALGRRFSRHNEIYQSDVVIPSCKPGVGAASRWSAPWPSYRTRREVHALPIVLMSFDRLFLDRVARQQSPSPLHRQPQLKLSPCWTGTSFHRTATTPLTSCLSPGVHFRENWENWARRTGENWGRTVFSPENHRHSPALHRCGTSGSSRRSRFIFSRHHARQLPAERLLLRPGPGGIPGTSGTPRGP